MDASCKNVLDIGDIAESFNCSREKVKRMARSGELPAFKFGKRWCVLRNDLERFLSDKVESSRHLRRIQEVSP
jgi:excisionase family DNA binding protein